MEGYPAVGERERRYHQARVGVVRPDGGKCEHSPWITSLWRFPLERHNSPAAMMAGWTSTVERVCCSDGWSKAFNLLCQAFYGDWRDKELGDGAICKGEPSEDPLCIVAK